jgi:UDP-sulfoquinovose synthase
MTQLNNNGKGGSMRILVLGGDGYLGWPTAMYFSARGHEVAVVDNMLKRYWEAEIGVDPLLPVPTLFRRVRRWKDLTGKSIELLVGDIARNHRFIYQVLERFRPDAIVHYAEQPSAPFSMMDRNKCVETQVNNVAGTLNLMFASRHVCPDVHIVKLGTMGEYGTPNIDIEEGWLEIEHKGRKDRVLYPKRPGSFYHLSKVHDSHNLEFGCRIWDMRVTDLNQGVVYGIETEEILLDPELITSFHYDAVFGTVLNRFIVQAIQGIPLSVYGKGGQTRGFLNIKDTLRCVELAVLNPGKPGEFRVFHQLTEQFSVNQLAERVQRVGLSRGLKVDIAHTPNPRIEMDDHYYNAKHSALPSLGLEPHLLTDEVIDSMMTVVQGSSHRIDQEAVHPKVKWRQN